MGGMFSSPKKPKTVLPPVPDPEPAPSPESEKVVQAKERERKRRQKATGGTNTVLTERYNSILGR